MSKTKTKTDFIISHLLSRLNIQDPLDDSLIIFHKEFAGKFFIPD